MSECPFCKIVRGEVHVRHDREVVRHVAIVTGESGSVRAEANADLIAHAPEDIAWLIGEVARAESLRLRAADLAIERRHQIQDALRVAEHARTRAEKAEAQVERVRALHAARTHDARNGWTGKPFTECSACAKPYPCPTTRALDGEVKS